MFWDWVARFELGCAALSIGAALFLARARGRRVRQALALIAPRDQAALEKGAAEEGTKVTVLGTLRVPRDRLGSEGVVYTHLPPGAERPVRPVLGATSSSLAGTWLEVPKKNGGAMRVLIEGDAQIVVGRVEGADDPIFAAARTAGKFPAHGSFHVLSDGDRVYACGRTSRVASGEEPGPAAGYRDLAFTTRLSGTPHDPLVLVERRGPPGPRGAGWFALLALALAASGLATRPTTEPEPIAAAPASSAAPACAHDIDVALAKNDLRGADALFEKCPDHGAEARVAFALGDFARAHEAFARARVRDPNRAPTVPEIQTAALAHDFADAARLTKALTAAWYRGPVTAEQRRLLCVQDAFIARDRGGAVAQLITPREPGGAPEAWCRFLAADFVQDPSLRASLLENAEDAYSTRRLLLLEGSGAKAGDLAIGRGDGSAPAPLYFSEPPLGALFDPGAWLWRRRIALEDGAARGVPPTAPIAGAVAADAALFRALMGSEVAARNWLDQVPASEHSEPTSFIVATAAAIYLGDDARAKKLVVLGSRDNYSVDRITRDALSEGTDAGARGFMRDGDPWSREIQSALDAHDASELANALSREPKTHLFAIARARRLGIDPAPLRAWYRASFPAPPWLTGVKAVGLRLGEALLVARLLDDREMVSLLAPRVAAFEQALLGRTLESRYLDVTLLDDLLESAQ